MSRAGSLLIEIGSKDDDFERRGRLSRGARELYVYDHHFRGAPEGSLDCVGPIVRRVEHTQSGVSGVQSREAGTEQRLIVGDQDPGLRRRTIDLAGKLKLFEV